MTFVKGQSGNPSGRPLGSRNKKTLLMEATLDREAPALAQKMIRKALDGDTTALRLCFDRLLPVGRDRPVVFPLPPIARGEDTRAAADDIVQGISTGELTPREAKDLLHVVTRVAHTLAAARDAQRAAILKANGGKPEVQLRWIEEEWPYPKHMAAERAKREAENKQNTSDQEGGDEQGRVGDAEASAGETQSNGENNKQDTRSWMEWDEPGWIRPADKSPGGTDNNEANNKQNTSGGDERELQGWNEALFPGSGKTDENERINKENTSAGQGKDEPGGNGAPDVSAGEGRSSEQDNKENTTHPDGADDLAWIEEQDPRHWGEHKKWHK